MIGSPPGGSATARNVMASDIEDIDAYDRFLRYELLDNELIVDVQLLIVVSTIKDTPALPIDEP